MKRLMRFNRIIGGMASTARSIFYKPKDTSRAATNVQAELDKINDDVSEINTHLSGMINPRIVTLGTSGAFSIAYANGLPKAILISCFGRDNLFVTGQINIDNGVVDNSGLVMASGTTILNPSPSISGNTLSGSFGSQGFTGKTASFIELY